MEIPRIFNNVLMIARRILKSIEMVSMSLTVEGEV